MDLYAEAEKLAASIRSSDKAQAFEQIKEEVFRDAASKRMIEYYKQLQEEAQKCMIAGKEPPADTMDKLRKMGDVLNFNPKITEYFASEYIMRSLAHDLFRIILDACGLETDWLEE